MEKRTERRDWGEVKNAYITGRESLNKLAEKYEIPLRTIKDRSRKENWVEERKKFRTEVAQKASQKTAKKEVKRLVKLRDVAEDVADLIGQDVERMKKLREKRKSVTPEDVKMIKDLTVALKNIADVMPGCLRHSDDSGKAAAGKIQRLQADSGRDGKST